MLGKSNVISLALRRKNPTWQQLVRGFESQSFLITCIDPRLNKPASILFPDFFTARYAGGAVSDNLQLASLAVGNTTRVLKDLENVVVMMHSNCAIIAAVCAGMPGLAAPVLNGSLLKVGKDSGEDGIIAASLETSITNLREKYGLQKNLFGLHYDLAKQHISIFQEGKLVPLDDSVPNPLNNPTMTKTFDRIRQLNRGISLAEIERDAPVSAPIRHRQ